MQGTFTIPNTVKKGGDKRAERDRMKQRVIHTKNAAAVKAFRVFFVKHLHKEQA